MKTRRWDLANWVIDEPGLDRMFGRYRATLCGATLLMILLSWPLWVDGLDFPRVPFFRGMPQLPIWSSWAVLVGMVTTLGMATLGRRWRAMLRINLPLLVYAILQDQDRFQPWAYQFAVVGLAMACMSRARALRIARWYIVGLYYYSGLSKFDASFCRELGPTFLSSALEPVGLSPRGWTESARTLACLGMPAFEIVVATLLQFAKTRRIGLIGSVAQHSALILILGPWSLGHSTIVLVWNMAILIQNLILFGRSTIPTDLEPETTTGRLTRRFFFLVMLLPAGERLGLCDAWPGHALYASHAERYDIYIHEEDVDRYPDAIRRRLGPSGVSPWRRLDLTGWSRDLRGTPLYPSGRVGNAIAEYLETKYGGPQPVKLVQWGRARAWDVPRERDESLGLRAIRRRADEFFFNAHPAGIGTP